MVNKLNVQIEGTVGGVADDGSGVIDQPNKPVFVLNTVPGEVVQVTTRRKVRDGIQADLDHVVKPSIHRTKPMCPYAGTCGGCKWQHIDYRYQLAMKRSLLKQTFAECGLEAPIEDVEGCPDPFYYRNRMDYVFGADGSLGLKEPGRWWSVLDLQSCFLLSKEAVEVMHRARDWARKTGLPFWNVKTHEGFFRYLVIREGKNTGERLVMLVTHRPIDESTEELMREFVSVLDGLATSVVWGVNPRVTDLSIAEEIMPLYGNPWLEEIVNGLRYRIYPNSFFQTNTTMAARLQDVVTSFCEPVEDKSILDLYCGSGFFTLALSHARKLTGIEIDPAAIEAARLNARTNGLQAEFHVAKAEEFDWIRSCPQVVILDPPRSGLHPGVIKTMRFVKPERIIYVSCNFARFAQELPFLLDHYHVKEMRALDLFPHTPHVELVTLLERL